MNENKKYDPVYEAYALLVKARDGDKNDNISLEIALSLAIGYLGEALAN